MDRRELFKKAAGIVGLSIAAPLANPSDAKPGGLAEAIQKYNRPEPEPIKGVGVFSYPPGETMCDGFAGVPAGEIKPVSNQELAMVIAKDIVQGVILCLPSTCDYHGNREWDFRIEGGDPGQVKIERKE